MWAQTYPVIYNNCIFIGWNLIHGYEIMPILDVIIIMSTIVTSWIFQWPWFALDKVSPCDNKSASHWIMFDYFFSCLKSKHFFFMIMFLIYSYSHVYSSIEKRSITMAHWPIFVYYPFCKWRRIAWHKASQW